MTTRQQIACNTVIEVPSTVAVCPICGGKLTAQMACWTQRDDGTWGPGETPHTECEHEPPMDGDEWDTWFRGHYSMPYVDWLPVEIHIQDWMERTFDFTGLDPSSERAKA